MRWGGKKKGVKYGRKRMKVGWIVFINFKCGK